VVDKSHVTFGESGRERYDPKKATARIALPKCTASRALRLDPGRSPALWEAWQEPSLPAHWGRPGHGPGSDCRGGLLVARAAPRIGPGSAGIIFWGGGNGGHPGGRRRLAGLL